MTLIHLVYAYLLGGVTFIPAAIALFIYLHPKKAPEVSEPPLKAAKIEEACDTGLKAFRQGWIVVTHEDLESQDDISGKTEAVGETPDGKSAYSSLYKLVTNTKVAVRGEKRDIGASENPDDRAATAKDEPLKGTPKMDAQTNEAMKDNTFTLHDPEEITREGPPAHRLAETSDGSPIPNGNPVPASTPSKKHRYYAVLKHGNLFLYKNERMQDVKHVIVLQNRIVAIWPRNLSEAALFTKYSLIALFKSDWSRARRLSESRHDSGTDWHSGKVTTQDVLDHTSGLLAPPGAIFIYTDYNTDKEDWYFALIRATKTTSYSTPALDPRLYAETLHFPTANSMKLIQALYSSEGQLQTKWINSILGRLFLSLQQTDIMQNYLILKIEKKLNKIKTPGFLDKFQIIHVDAGTAAPLISYPVLKEMNPEGNLLLSFDVHYTGGLSMQLATKVNINLGSRFKTREVDVLLSITFEKISGPMLLRVKPPPSTRLWYTFESEPQLGIKIEPVISSRLMSYGVITNTIDKKFKDAIRDTLVFPHWDDVVFYHTPDELYRGGLWDKSVRPTNKLPKEDNRSKEDKSAPIKENIESDRDEKDAEDLVRLEDVNSVFTAGSDEAASLSSITGARSKDRIAAAISDLSQRLRKPKSTSTLGVDETSILSDGSEVQLTSTLLSLATNAAEPSYTGTIRKIGSWYNKPTKTPSSPLGIAYVPPEMITNRRPRKQSLATIGSDPERAERPELPGYDFGSSVFSDGRISNTLDVQSTSSAAATRRKPPPDSP